MLPYNTDKTVQNRAIKAAQQEKHARGHWRRDNAALAMAVSGRQPPKGWSLRRPECSATETAGEAAGG